MSFSCVSCDLAFSSLGEVKAHYKTELHVYNLKRKTAGIAPVSEAAFLRRKAALLARQREAQRAKTGGVEDAVAWKCTACQKTFKSHKAYLSHTQSRKHAAAVAAAAKANADAQGREVGAGMGAGAPALSEESGRGSGTAAARAQLPEAAARTVEVVTAEEEATVSAPERPRAVPPTTCFFDGAEHPDVESNLRYMEEQFSFFLPDREFCVDVEGLAKYLGQKVGLGHMCLYCNRVFQTVGGTMQHMRDASHCKMAYDEESLYEYESYYDFSTSYSAARFAGREAEVDEIGELRLPDGRIVGHRDYLPYYKQSFAPGDARESVQAAGMHLLQNQAAAPGSRALTAHTGPRVHHVSDKEAAAQRISQREKATHQLRAALQQNIIKRKYEKRQDYQWG